MSPYMVGNLLMTLVFGTGGQLLLHEPCRDLRVLRIHAEEQLVDGLPRLRRHHAVEFVLNTRIVEVQLQALVSVADLHLRSRHRRGEAKGGICVRTSLDIKNMICWYEWVFLEARS